MRDPEFERKFAEQACIDRIRDAIAQMPVGHLFWLRFEVKPHSGGLVMHHHLATCWHEVEEQDWTSLGAHPQRRERRMVLKRVIAVNYSSLLDNDKVVPKSFHATRLAEESTSHNTTMRVVEMDDEDRARVAMLCHHKLWAKVYEFAREYHKHVNELLRVGTR